MESLERLNASLRMQQVEMARRLEDLSNSIMVLQDRLETMKVASERAQKVYESKESKKIKKTKLFHKEDLEPQETFLGVGDSQLKGRSSKLRLTNSDLVPIDKKVKEETLSKAVTENAENGGEQPEAILAYNEAYKKFEEQNYTEAVKSLEEFVRQFPNHVYSDNAAFWIGESWFRSREFEKAANQFERVARDYPSGNKVPDALLKAGSCYLYMSKPKEAREALEKLITLYPQSVAAQKAKGSLAEMIHEKS